MTPFNSDQLRTFLAIADAGSVTAGARRINRSQSATSLQIRQLEAAVGKPLFHRHGRGIMLTPAGERLLPVARKVSQTMDAALAELRDEGMRGRLRIGVTDNHRHSSLTRIIADFTALHPDVELEVYCAFGAGFDAALKTGRLDLAIYEVPEPDRRDEVLREDSLIWMCSSERDIASEEIMPVALFDRDCWWREAALSGLEEAGRRYRIVFTSESTLGVRAAAGAGIAAALFARQQDTSGLTPVRGLDIRQKSFLVLRKAQAAQNATADAMCDAIRNAF